MRRILRFIRRDIAHLRGNVIALVVIFGIIVVPTFYAWFNIAGSWDPYDNTANLKVAVANNDEGYTSELAPIEVNAGERVVSDLRETETFGYEVTSEDDAVEGVRSGKYYAAVVIPADFSRDMMSILSDSPTQPTVEFYQNEKANSIATIVTDKSSTQIQQDIESSFSSSVVKVGTSLLDELDSTLSDAQVMQAASKLDQALTNSVSQVGDVTENVRAYSAIISSTQELLGSGSGLASTSLESAANVGGTLRDTADGIRGLGNALDGTTDSINDAIATGASSVDSVSAAIDQAFDTADGQVGKLEDGLAQAKTAVNAINDQFKALSEKLAGSDTLYRSFEESFQEGNASITTIHETRLTIQGLNKIVQETIRQLANLSDELQETVDDLKAGTADTQSARDKLKGQVASAKGSLAQVQSDYEDNVRGSLRSLAGQIDSAASDADNIVGSIRQTLDSVGSAAQDASGSLGGAKGSLDTTASELDQLAGRLSDLQAQVKGALDSDDINQVRAVLSASPSQLASFISAPVAIDRNAIFPIENNGSAMTPFYTTLSIWIGGVILCALVKASPSEAALRETGCGHGESYVGRIVLFLSVGALQTLLICLGDLYFLGVQCAHPALFVLAGLVSSFTYINIIYALTASFGDVGKAIAVVLMVLQVAGSGGTFPMQMLPAPFQAIYPYLPFVHSANAMRTAMFGLYEADYWVELARLLSFTVPFLLLGLVLRRPVIRLNEWVERKIESTKVM